MGYQGQVRFADALLVEGNTSVMLAPSLFAPRAHAHIYYGKNGKVVGRKFYFHGQPAKGNVPLEVCEAGSRFRLRIDFSNLTEAELGLLLTAMGQGDLNFVLKLGGAKPACCGSVEVRIGTADVQDVVGGTLSFDAFQRETRLEELTEFAKELLVAPNLESLCRIFGTGARRSCPSQSY